MDQALLEKIGLTKNESIVYLTLLKLGLSKSAAVLKQSNLNSGKIYEILESLKSKGLVAESIINNVKHFAAAPPQQILEYLERKKEELDFETASVKQSLPELEKLRTETLKEVKAVTYTGLQGIKTAADEALASVKPGEEILGMGITRKKDPRINLFWKRWHVRRLERKIRALHLFSETSEYFTHFKKMKYTEARILTGITPVTVDIFGNDKVLILNYAEPTSCILIHDENTATSFRNFFYQLWKTSKDK